MNRMEKREYAASTIRPKIRRLLAEYLAPAEPVRVRRPFKGPLPDCHTVVTEASIPRLVASCEIDHTVPPSLDIRGGRRAAEKQLGHFLERNLRRYARRHARYTGKPDSLDNLPAWTLQTLRRHAGDQRPWLYTREQFEQARPHDALWNACQKELLLRGVIHGYYRMYWGKKIIEWSATHEEALETMVYLHDRPWGERPVFGSVRYMSIQGMRRKTDVDAYIAQVERLAASAPPELELQ